MTNLAIGPRSTMRQSTPAVMHVSHIQTESSIRSVEPQNLHLIVLAGEGSPEG